MSARRKRHGPPFNHTETTLENLAQIALSGFDASKMAKNWQDAEMKEAEALSDAMRDRLMLAATALADIERNLHKQGDISLWDNHDWRETCDRIAGALNRGEHVNHLAIEVMLGET